MHIQVCVKIYNRIQFRGDNRVKLMDFKPPGINNLIALATFGR